MTAAGNDRLLPFAEVSAMTGLGRTRIYALIKASTFPTPFKPGGSASRWSEAEVRAWVLEQRQSPWCGLPST